MAPLVLQLPLECRFQLDSNIPTIATETPPTKILLLQLFLFLRFEEELFCFTLWVTDFVSQWCHCCQRSKLLIAVFTTRLKLNFRVKSCCFIYGTYIDAYVIDFSLFCWILFLKQINKFFISEFDFHFKVAFLSSWVVLNSLVVL